MSWQDMGLYWAWRGKGDSDCPPPSIKALRYEDFGYQRICSHVIENGMAREVNIEERALHRG